VTLETHHSDDDSNAMILSFKKKTNVPVSTVNNQITQESLHGDSNAIVVNSRTRNFIPRTRGATNYIPRSSTKYSPAKKPKVGLIKKKRLLVLSERRSTKNYKLMLKRE
jgi:hypothetical protein